MSNSPSPTAKYSGNLMLGSKGVDCYVLDDGRRVISLSGAIRSIANVQSGNLSSYLRAKSLQPYLELGDPESIYIDFSIPGNPNNAKGLMAETFLEICRAYVSALTDAPETLTGRQREIAVNCAILLAACAKVGLIAPIDEATGYQYEREADALSVKLKAYIADELRDWEKTFPDALWEEFGRLTNWAGSLHSRPKYWGKLVYELIYQALDPDIAEYIKVNKPKPRHGQNYHQWLTEDIGVKSLIEHINQIIGIAKTCTTMDELRRSVAHYYKHEPIQTSFFLQIGNPHDTSDTREP